MAIVGQQLLQPESGWRRYDDRDSRIQYIGNGWTKETSSDEYNSTLMFISGVPQSDIYNCKTQFKFFGTKLRGIMTRYSDYATLSIKVDGIVKSTINMRGSGLRQVLAFDIQNLELKNHTVEICSITEGRWDLDAIDIDDIGYLLQPILNQVSDFSQVKNIGDCIPCRYVALTSGQAGIFSELGTCVANEIPLTGSATPDGLFHWVYVGKDYLGRKKFIADRNIQHTISWDALNIGGVCGEKLIDLGLGANYKSYIRLLTGGVSSIDLDNEWDNIIVNSSLGGKITPGDDNVWHWNNLSSWTSTTQQLSIYGSNGRVVRGGNPSGHAGAINLLTVKAFAAKASGETSTTVGLFRPVLLIESLITCKFLMYDGSNYYSVDPKYYDESTHKFTPITLTGGIDPNKNDIESFGFNNLNLLIAAMTKGSDTFKPIDKLKNYKIKCYIKN